MKIVVVIHQHCEFCFLDLRDSLIDDFQNTPNLLGSNTRRNKVKFYSG